MAENTPPQTADDKERADELAAQADFDAGAAMEETPKAKAKPDSVPETPAKPEPAAREQAAPKPEYVRITKQDWDGVLAAAARTAAQEAQLSKAFGTIGNMQKVINALQAATPQGFKVEIPKDAFAGMERDFPELAQHTRAALEATLRGVTGTAPASADPDPEQFQLRVSEQVAKLRTEAEIEALADDYPDWETIVGRINEANGEKPDPENPYRKWLATKDQAYQARLYSTNSAAVISRSIKLFQAETKAAAPTLDAQLKAARAARIRGAVQQRGDGGQAPAGPSDEDEFASGFASG